MSYSCSFSSFSQTLIIKCNANNGRSPPFCLFPALTIPFQDIPFINEEATGSIHEEATGAVNEAALSLIIAPQNPPFCFLISCFTFSVTPSINRPESPSDLTILIISTIYLFEMNKVNLFPFPLYRYSKFKSSASFIAVSLIFVIHLVNGAKLLNATSVARLRPIIVMSPFSSM